MTFESDNYDAVDSMKRIVGVRFRISRLLVGIACLLAAVSLVIAAALLTLYDAVRSENVTPEPFDAFTENRDCSVTIQFLAGPFASSYDDKQSFYWGYGQMMEPYIICFTDGLPENCSALLEFTSGPDLTAPPEPAVLQGYSVSIENTDIYDYAMEFYQAMWGLDGMNRNEFKETVATCYLDYGKRNWIQRLPWYGTVLAFLLPLVCLTTGIRQFRGLWIQKKRENARMARLSAVEKQMAAGQLENSTEFEPGSRIYLTRDFVITGNYQFDIIPYDRITSLAETGGYLIAVTADGMAHIILSSGRRKLSQISWLEHLKRVLEDKILYTQT